MRTTALIGYKAASDIVAKLSFFLVVVIAARALPPAAFGLFSLAATLGWVIGVASDFGLQLHLARTVSLAPEAAASTLARLARPRVALAAAGMVLAAPVAVLVSPPGEVVWFLVIVAAQVTASLVEFVSHVYRGLSRSEIESSLTLAQRLVTLAAVALLGIWPRLAVLALALLLPAAAALAVTSVLVRRVCLTPSPERRLRSPSFGESAVAVAEAGVPSAVGLVHNRLWSDVAPLGAGLLLSALYFRLDLFLIDAWIGVEAVAGYNAVFRLVEALRLLPAAALAVTFPLLCRARDFRLLARLSAALAGTGLLAAAVAWWLGGWTVALVYGDTYLTAVPVFHLLLLSVPLFFLNYALTHQLIGWEAPGAYARICAAALVANVALNVWLLPRLGVAGAAWATLGTELVVTAGCVLALRRRGREAMADGDWRIRGSGSRVPGFRGSAVPGFGSGVPGFRGAEVPGFGPGGSAAFGPADRPSLRVLELAIAKTVVYSSLFDYPLSLAQVRESLIGARAGDAAILRCYRRSPRLRAAIDYRDGHFFPRGRSDLLAVRRLREASTRLLLRRHRRVLRLICTLPYTRLVALSGSAAHLNVTRDGDLDLFIVTAGRPWSVTLAIVLLTKVLGCRRTFCVNYVVSETALTVPQDDLFSANQIIHLRPLVGEATLRRFVAANPFVSRYYPMFRPPEGRFGDFAPGRVGRAVKAIAEGLLAPGIGAALEASCRVVYGRYLRNRAMRWRSPEQVVLDAERVKLHGHSHRGDVLRRFERTVHTLLAEANAGVRRQAV